MNGYELTTFRAGISDYEDIGPEGSFKFGRNIDIRKPIDTISCQQALIEDAPNGTFTGLAYFIISASDGNTYFFCNDGKIIKRTSAGAYSTAYIDPSGAIKGAAEWYDRDTGKVFLYWATDTKLNRKELPGNTATPWIDVNADPSWPRTNLTSAAWHTMRITANQLSICNDSKIAFVGYDSSFTNEGLDLIPGNIAKTLIESDIYVKIGGDRKDIREFSGLFIWDTTADSWNGKKIVPEKTINSMIDTEIPLLQVGSKGNIYYGDMQAILPITSFPGGGMTNPHGVTNDDGLALFGVWGNGAGKTGIYSYGRKKKIGKFALNLEYQFDCDEIGAVEKVGNDIFCTYRTGATFGIKKVDSTTKAQALYQSIDLNAPVEKDTTKLTSWTYVRLELKPLPVGCSVEVWRKINKSAEGFKQAELEGGGVQFNTEGGTEAVFKVGDGAEKFELQIICNPAGNLTPDVYKASIYVE